MGRAVSTPLSEVENRLWAAADNLRANSRLRSSEYSTPVLGLIFLRFADERFEAVDRELRAQTQVEGSRRTIGQDDYLARGVVYLPPEARYDYLLKLPEGENLGRAVNEAMKAIEEANEDLKGALPKSYTRLDNETLTPLLRVFAPVRLLMDKTATKPGDASLDKLEGDVFGKIYEYFLGKFAMSEGQKGGEFFTPTSLVRLIVEIIEPYHWPHPRSGLRVGRHVRAERALCGGASAQTPDAEISIYGQEKVAETVRLCRMNLAVHGLSGDIRQANTYYETCPRLRRAASIS